MKMIRYLKVSYSRRFHSLVIVARSFENLKKIDVLVKAYPKVVEFISVRTLIEISDLLENELELEDTELRNSFLKSLVSQRGILSLANILEKPISYLERQASMLPKLLKSAEQTLAYWEQQYSTYAQRRELAQRLEKLKKELLWSKINEKRQEKHKWKQLTDNAQTIRANMQETIIEIETKVYNDPNLTRSLERLRTEEKRLFQLETEMRLELENRDKEISLETEEALKLGSEIKTITPSTDLSEEIMKISIKLNELPVVSDDIEKMYSSYNKLYEELRSRTTKIEKEKMKLVDLQRKLKDITNGSK
jgi:chromosome segregation ATPase